MATTPPRDLLDREVAKAHIQEALDIAVPLLQETVNQGLAVVARCAQSARGGDEHLPITLGLRHLVELADGVAALVAESAFVPARPLLRAQFEALLQIEFILQDETICRAYNYLVADIRRRIEIYAELDADSRAGQVLRNRFEGDAWMESFELPQVEDLSARQSNLENLLRKPNWREADQRFDLARKKRRRPRWYSLDGGPQNLRELADVLGRSGQYKLLYGDWSTTTHAGDFLRPLTKSEQGGPAMLGLRNPSMMSATVSLCALMTLDATRAVLTYYRPGEERSFARWYLTEVTEPLKQLDRIYAKLGLGPADSSGKALHNA